ncbi:unnamed protein product, partial [Prorocentrum cordatum]
MVKLRNAWNGAARRQRTTSGNLIQVVGTPCYATFPVAQEVTDAPKGVAMWGAAHCVESAAYGATTGTGHREPCAQESAWVRRPAADSRGHCGDVELVLEQGLLDLDRFLLHFADGRAECEAAIASECLDDVEADAGDEGRAGVDVPPRHLTPKAFLRLGKESLGDDSCLAPDDGAGGPAVGPDGAPHAAADLAIVPLPLPDAAAEDPDDIGPVEDIVIAGASLRAVSVLWGRVRQCDARELTDAVSMRIADHYLSTKRSHASLKVEAGMLGTTPFMLSSRRRCLAMAGLSILHSDAINGMQQIISNTRKAGGKLLLFTESCHYGETPMRLRVSDVEFNAVLMASSTLSPEEERLAASLREVSQQKIVATFWVFSLMVEGLFERAVFLDAPRCRMRALGDSWAGHDKPLDWIGGLACIHGIFQDAYVNWCATFKDVVGDVGAGGVDGAPAGGAAAPPMLLDGDAGPHLGMAEAAAAAPAAHAPADGGQPDALPEWKVQQQELARRRQRVRDWISRPTFLAETIVLRRVAEVHRFAMQSLLWMSGSAWDLRQRAEEGRAVLAGRSGFNLRSYRALSLASGVPDVQVIGLIKQLMNSGGMWRVLPANCRSLSLRLKVFKQLSRSLCLMLEFQAHRSTCPFKPFRLLLEPGLIDEILAEEHMWDDWFASFHSHCTSGGRGGVTSTIALADLRCTLLLLMHDTVPVEVGHSRFRRQLEGSSVQTHRQAIEDASAAELLRRFRAFEQAFQDIRVTGAPESGAGGLAAAPAAAPSAQAASSSQAAESAPSRKRRSHGGGPYRAFLSQRFKNVDGKVNWGGSTSADYRRDMADPVKREVLIDAGKRATEQVRMGGKKPFGLGKRDIERQSLKSAREAHAKHALAMHDANLERQDVAQSMSLMPLSASAASPADSWKAVLDLKAVCSAQTKMQQELRAAEVRSLANYARDAGLGSRSLQVGAVCEQKADHLPMPNGYPACYDHEWMPAGVMTKSKQLLSISTSSVVGQTIQNRLFKTWAKLHKICGGPRRPEIIEAARKLGDVKKNHRCKFLGCCVCDVGGAAHVGKVAAKFKAALRSSATASAGFKQKLLDGDVVAAFIGRDVGADGGFTEGADDSVIVLWAHVGWQWQRPWESLFHYVEAPRGDAAQISPWCSRPRRVTSLLDGSGTVKFFSKLNLDKRWDVSFWELRRSRGMLGSFVPNVAECDPAMPVNPIHLLWMLRRGLPPGKRKKRGWSIDLSKYDGSEDDDFDGEDVVADGVDAAVDDELDGGRVEGPGFDIAAADAAGDPIDLPPEPAADHVAVGGAAVSEAGTESEREMDVIFGEGGLERPWNQHWSLENTGVKDGMVRGCGGCAEHKYDNELTKSRTCSGDELLNHKGHEKEAELFDAIRGGIGLRRTPCEGSARALAPATLDQAFDMCHVSMRRAWSRAVGNDQAFFASEAWSSEIDKSQGEADDGQSEDPSQGCSSPRDCLKDASAEVTETGAVLLPVVEVPARLPDFPDEAPLDSGPTRLMAAVLPLETPQQESTPKAPDAVPLASMPGSSNDLPDSEVAGGDVVIAEVLPERMKTVTQTHVYNSLHDVPGWMVSFFNKMMPHFESQGAEPMARGKQSARAKQQALALPQGRAASDEASDGCESVASAATGMTPPPPKAPAQMRPPPRRKKAPANCVGCGVCNTSPWAEYIKKANGEQVPVGPGDAECYKTWLAGFQTDGSFEEVLEKCRADSQYKECFQKADSIRKGLTKAVYRLADIAKSTSQGYRAYRCKVGLKPVEFESIFNGTIEDAGLKLQDLPNEFGVMFKGALVNDPDRPGVRYDVFHETALEKVLCIMSKSDHFWSGQEDKIFESVFKSDLNPVGSALQKLRTQSVEPNEIRQAIFEKSGKTSSGPIGVSSSGGLSASGSGGAAAAASAAGGPEVDAEFDELMGDTIVAAESGPMLHDATPVAKTTAGRGKSTPSCAASSELGLRRGGSTMYGDLDDDDGTPDGKRRKFSTTEWIQKLDLMKALSGAAMARKKTFAQTHYNNTPASDTKKSLLAEQILLVGYAIDISECDVAKVEGDFITTRIEELLRATHDGIQRFLKTIFPLNISGCDDEDNFDWKVPKLWQCEGSPSEFASYFTAGLEKLIVPLLTKNSEPIDIILKACSWCLEAYADVLSHEMDDSYAEALLDACTCWRGCLGLFNVAASTTHDRAIKMLIDRPPKGKEDSLPSVARATISRVMEFKQYVDDYTVKGASTLLTAPKFQEAMASLQEAATMSSTTEAVMKYPEFKANMRQGMVDGMEAELLGLVQFYANDFKEFMRHDVPTDQAGRHAVVKVCDEANALFEAVAKHMVELVPGAPQLVSFANAARAKVTSLHRLECFFTLLDGYAKPPDGAAAAAAGNLPSAEHSRRLVDECKGLATLRDAVKNNGSYKQILVSAAERTAEGISLVGSVTAPGCKEALSALACLCNLAAEDDSIRDSAMLVDIGQAAITLHSTMSEFSALGDTVIASADADANQVLAMKMMSESTALRELPGMLSPNMRCDFAVAVDDAAKRLLANVSDAILDRRKRSVFNLIDQVFAATRTAYKKDGSLWKDGFSGSWDDLVALANSTIMSVVDGDALTRVADALSADVDEFCKEVQRYDRMTDYKETVLSAKLVSTNAMVIVQEASIFLCFKMFGEQPVKLRKGLIKDMVAKGLLAAEPGKPGILEIMARE